VSASAVCALRTRIKDRRSPDFSPSRAVDECLVCLLFSGLGHFIHSLIRLSEQCHGQLIASAISLAHFPSSARRFISATSSSVITGPRRLDLGFSDATAFVFFIVTAD